MVIAQRTALGASIVLFYSLIVAGRFFGELSVPHAIVLFASPLLAWLPELPPVRRLPRWRARAGSGAAGGAVVAAVVADEVRMFIANTPVAGDSEFEEPTVPGDVP